MATASRAVWKLEKANIKLGISKTWKQVWNIPSLKDYYDFTERTHFINSIP